MNAFIGRLCVAVGPTRAAPTSHSTSTRPSWWSPQILTSSKRLEAPPSHADRRTEPSTPTELSTIAWQQAPKSALVVRHGDDHGTFFGRAPFTDRVVSQMDIDRLFAS